jgi:hypothetical protein
MRHSVRARLLLTSVCTVCALALPASALATGGSPVHVDPSSPVAKEYALPLATARGAPPESGTSGKLFGSGIKHSSSHAADTITAVTTTPPPPTALTRTVTARPLAAKATPAAYRVLRPGSGSGWLWMVLAAVLVLALGSAGGLALSRRR